jgi:hypothetical protein
MGAGAVLDDAAACEQAVTDIASVCGHGMARAESGTDGYICAVCRGVCNEHEGTRHAGAEAKAIPTAAGGG